MKYLVMECRSAYAVVLTDDGQFLKVANMRYEVGQTVTDVTPLKLPEKKDTHKKHWLSAVAAMAACLVLVVSSLLLPATPYASVYMTINPQVRIDVNRKDMVVGITGVNEDGVLLLDGYDHSRKDLDTVMDELVDRAIDMGYLHQGGKITVQLDADAQWVNSHSAHLNEHLSEHLSSHVTEGITVIIDIFGGPETSAATAEPTVPAEPTLPAGPIVIPLNPQGESDYGESDYGDTDHDDDRDDDDGEDDDDEEDDDDDDDDDDGQTDYGQAKQPKRDNVTEKSDDSGYDKDTDYSKEKESDFDRDDDD